MTLPAAFFTQEGDGKEDGKEFKSHTEHGRWIRFSVANVDDDKVVKVCERLAEFDPLR